MVDTCTVYDRQEIVPVGFMTIGRLARFHDRTQGGRRVLVREEKRNMKRETRLLTGIASAASLAVVAASANAHPDQGTWENNHEGNTGTAGYFQSSDGYTFTNASIGAEDGIAQIISDVYGGTAVEGGMQLGNSHSEYTVDIGGGETLTFERVLDAGGSTPLDLHDYSSGQTDQIWQDGLTSFRATAKQASFNGTFSYVQDGTTYDIFDVGSGQGSGVGQTATFDIATSDTFTFQYDSSDNSNGGVFSSDQSKNDGFDHLVTYHVTSENGTYNSGRPVFLLFWEDMDPNHADWDYNDLVIELAVIPLPAPLAMGLIGLAGIAAVRRRMK